MMSSVHRPYLLGHNIEYTNQLTPLTSDLTVSTNLRIALLKETASAAQRQWWRDRTRVKRAPAGRGRSERNVPTGRGADQECRGSSLDPLTVRLAPPPPAVTHFVAQCIDRSSQGFADILNQFWLSMLVFKTSCSQCCASPQPC